MLNVNLEFRQMIEIEHRADQGDDREDDHDASYHLINNKDAVGIKLASNLVDEPSQPKPPEQGTEDDAQVAYAHLQRHVGNDEGKLGEGGHEQEHDEGIGQRDKERRQPIMEERALLVAALVHVAGRIALEAIDAKYKQEQTSEDLEIELVLGIVDEIHHKAHSQSREKRIHDVAAGSAHTGHETIPTPLVQRALDTQDAYRSHRGGGNNTYDNSLEYEIKNIYLYWKHYTHTERKDTIFWAYLVTFWAKTLFYVFFLV